MGRGGLRAKRILKHNYQFYNLQEKFRKGKVSAGFQKKIQYFEIRKCVRDGSRSPRKGLKEEKSSQKGFWPCKPPHLENTKQRAKHRE